MLSAGTGWGEVARSLSRRGSMHTHTSSLGLEGLRAHLALKATYSAAGSEASSAASSVDTELGRPPGTEPAGRGMNRNWWCSFVVPVEGRSRDLL